MKTHFAGISTNRPRDLWRGMPRRFPRLRREWARPVVGGVAHPIRLGVRDPAAAEEALVKELRDVGLGGIEVYHSDHAPGDVARYAAIPGRATIWR